MWAKEIRRLLQAQFTLMKGLWDHEVTSCKRAHEVTSHYGDNIVNVNSLFMACDQSSLPSFLSILFPSPLSLPCLFLRLSLCRPPLLPFSFLPPFSSPPPIYLISADMVLKSGTLNRATYRGKARLCESLLTSVQLKIEMAPLLCHLHH